MNTPQLTRRKFVNHSLAAVGSAMLTSSALPLTAAEDKAARRLKVICVGAHPDDPESGCAGTLARYASTGHTVTVIYLTRGERGIPGKSNDEAAAIRTAESEAACKLIGAKPLFAGQIDGDTEVNRARAEALLKLLAAEQPDLILTHWPIDTHPDHQSAAQLTIRAALVLPRRAELFFFEVNTGSQSLGFVPNTYVDIKEFLQTKKRALFAHQSQNGEGIWKKHHELIAEFRGREAGVTAAEAFFRLNRMAPQSRLPGF